MPKSEPTEISVKLTLLGVRKELAAAGGIEAEDATQVGDHDGLVLTTAYNPDVAYIWSTDDLMQWIIKLHLCKCCPAIRYWEVRYEEDPQTDVCRFGGMQWEGLAKAVTVAQAFQLERTTGIRSFASASGKGFG